MIILNIFALNLGMDREEAIQEVRDIVAAGSLNHVVINGVVYSFNTSQLSFLGSDVKFADEKFPERLHDPP